MGQPAACMIENNPGLSAREWFFGTRDYGPKHPARRAHRRACLGQPRRSVAALQCAWRNPCTVNVDNFVGNPPMPVRRASKSTGPNRLLIFWAGNFV